LIQSDLIPLLNDVGRSFHDEAINHIRFILPKRLKDVQLVLKARVEFSPASSATPTPQKDTTNLKHVLPVTFRYIGKNSLGALEIKQQEGKIEAPSRGSSVYHLLQLAFNALFYHHHHLSPDDTHSDFKLYTNNIYSPVQRSCLVRIKLVLIPTGRYM